METTVEPPAVTPEDRVKAAFPAKYGELRKVHPLFGTCFRVDFHDTLTDNRVCRSFFVEVLGEEIKVHG